MSRTLRGSATALLVTGSIGLAACSSSPSTRSNTTSSTTASSSATTPSPTTSTPAVSSTSNATYDGPAGVPVAARAHTDAGRIAFARYYVQQINETGKHPKVGVLEPLALPTCKSCSAFADSVKQLEQKGNQYTTDTFVVQRSEPLAQDPSVTELVCSQNQIHEVDQGGRVVNTTAAIKRFGLVFYLSWANSWRVSEIQNDMSVAS